MSSHDVIVDSEIAKAPAACRDRPEYLPAVPQLERLSRGKLSFRPFRYSPCADAAPTRWQGTPRQVTRCCADSKSEARAANTGADVLIETLIRWGVEVVFGLPGDGINGIMEALRTRQGQIRFVQMRHEEAAAFAACGYAKMTGKLGCCLATSGPGGLHLLTGLYDAKMDRAPVIAITGMPFHDLIDTETQQDVALDRVFTDVAAFNTRVMGPTHIENAVTQACRTGRRAGRCPMLAVMPSGRCHGALATRRVEFRPSPAARIYNLLDGSARALGSVAGMPPTPAANCKPRSAARGSRSSGRTAWSGRARFFDSRFLAFQFLEALTDCF